jgi:hypothetical protein
MNPMHLALAEQLVNRVNRQGAPVVNSDHSEVNRNDCGSCCLWPRSPFKKHAEALSIIETKRFAAETERFASNCPASTGSRDHRRDPAGA